MDMIDFVYIFPFPTLIQFIESLGGIQHSITVVGNRFFDIDIPFALRITHDELYYCCTNDDYSKYSMVTKVYLKLRGSLKKRK